MIQEYKETWKAVLHTLKNQIKPQTFISQNQNQKTMIAPLQNYVIIIVSGAKARHFLQGQCTCNFEKLNENIATFGSHCTPKGRMIASFIAKKIIHKKNNSDIDKNIETFGLRVHSSCAEALQTSLTKYGIFSNVKITTEQNIFSFSCLNFQDKKNGSWLQEWEEILEKEAFSTKDQNQSDDNESHNPKTKEIWLSKEDVEKISIESKHIPIVSLDSDSWELHQVRSGIYNTRESTSGKLLPQEINHQCVNAIDFKKGCYTGQEIIARIHYKGQLKKHMRRFVLKADESHIKQILIHSKINLDTENTCSDISILKSLSLSAITDTNNKPIDLGQILIAIKTKQEEIEYLSIIKDETISRFNNKETQNYYISIKDEKKPIEIYQCAFPYAIT